MKKQILFLAFFTLALIFAGTNNVFGQSNPIPPDPNDNLSTATPTCPTPNAVQCPSTALTPVPGTPYTYSIAVPTNLAAGATFKYRWFVTQDENIITTTGGVTTITSNVEVATGSGLYVASAVANYDNIASGSNSIIITWKSFTHDPTAPVLVVIYVEGEDGCLTNNIEVFEIKPQHAFTLDIANMAPDGTLPGAAYSTCVSPVESAVYTAGSLTMDYGTNYLYYAVTAANFTDSWLPAFTLTGNVGGTQTTLIEWQYPALANIATGWHAATDVVVANAAATAGGGVAIGTAGECIIVRVTVDNNKEETIAAQSIALAVNGVMNDPTTPAVDYTNNAYEDVHYVTCLADGIVNDVATHILKPRPDLVSTTPASATNPAIQPFNGKN